MKLKNPPPLGLGHFTVLEVAPPDLVTLAAQTGYAAVGLRLHPAFPGAPFYEIPCGSAQMQEMRCRLDDTGIRVYDIEFVILTEDFRAARLAAMLASASELGAQRLNVCGGDSERSRLLANFAELCDLAADFGMGVDLECMAWQQVASFTDAVRVIEQVGKTNAGALVDALHLSRTGGLPSDLRNVSPERIKSAQLCDAPSERPASTETIIQEARSGRLPPGQGGLPLCELLAELPEHAVLSVEVPMADEAPAEERARQIFAATQGLFRVFGGLET